MPSITSAVVGKTIEQLNLIAKNAGIDLDFRVRGSVRVEDLGFDLGFNNRDCNGVCSTNCSGCSACSGCSGCNNTSSSKSVDPGSFVSNPDPVSRFLTDLRDPAVQDLLSKAAGLAAQR